MKETKIYLAPFHSSFTGDPVGPCARSARDLSQAIQRGEWPYDTGDDPSFFCARKYEGQLTWGICRQDVRNHLEPGDIVVFFSFRKKQETQLVEYRLCAVATVERKVCQTDLWKPGDLKRYRRYFNLLIRPLPHTHFQCWEHYEPSLNGGRLHKDWIWRIAEHCGLKKSAFDRLEQRNCFAEEDRVGGHPLAIAPNYVIFSRNPRETYILPNPPIVAWYTNGAPPEKWKQDAFCQKVKELTLETATRLTRRVRFLRTTNSQRAHRHVVWNMFPQEASAWRERLIELISS